MVGKILENKKPGLVEYSPTKEEGVHEKLTKKLTYKKNPNSIGLLADHMCLAAVPTQNVETLPLRNVVSAT